jgi:hypothetical protein
MAVTESIPAAPAAFSIGGALREALTLVRGNFLVLFGISLLLGIPIIVLMVVGVAVLSALGDAAGADTVNAIMGNFGAVILLTLGGLVVIAAWAIADAAMIVRIAEALRGRRPGVLACVQPAFGAGFRLFANRLLMLLAFGVLGAAVLGSLWAAFDAEPGRSIGFAWVIVVTVLAALGYLVLSTLWWVATPAIVLEGAGPIAAFRRSLALTRGRRWKIAGLLLLLMLVQGLVQAAVDALLGKDNAGGSAFSLVFYAYSIMLAAVGWYRLRGEKEGYGEVEARVFD